MDIKLYTCNNCGRKVQIRSKGLCPSCRKKERENSGELTKPNYSIPSITRKTLEKKRQKIAELNPYFEYHINRIVSKGLYCENECGVKLQGLRSEVAHILPKREAGGHPEVKSNLDNALYLCVNCHTKFDNNQLDLGKIKTFPVWEKAVERYHKFKHLIVKFSKYIETIESWKQN